MKNAIYAQSGGVTAVINATACGVIETARARRADIGKVFAARNGIVGVLNEELFDTSRESKTAISGLKSTPGGAFGSCRYKLMDVEQDDREGQRLIDVFRSHNIGYFFYNGGGDSQDTCNKIVALGRRFDYPITCIGIPKTVDNDLPATDTCPGFGSVAKYVAVSVKEAALDVMSMCATSTKVFIMEVMGRHSGWIAAAGGLAGADRTEPPHIILFPEIGFDRERFIDRVGHSVRRYGYCVVVASEGTKFADGAFLSDSGSTDAFGHKQLGGVAQSLAQMVDDDTGFKNHFAVADYLQRSARHIASATDVAQAYAVGKAAVDFALDGVNGKMVTIRRTQDSPYRWKVGTTSLNRVANVERQLPRSYITKDGFGITARARRYLSPLIQGEAFPRYRSGIPVYTTLKCIPVRTRLAPYDPAD